MQHVQKFTNVLDNSQISFILSNQKVIEARLQLENMNKVSFTIELPIEIKFSILNSTNLDLTNITDIPMRWVKGFTPPHIDQGQSDFSNTYLIYLTDNQGYLKINNTNYEIHKGTAYVFSNNQIHETVLTDNEPRLLLGPLSEQGFAVGNSITYYSSYNNATTSTNPQYDGTFTILTNSQLTTPFPDIGNVSSWVVFNGSPDYAIGTIFYAGQTISSTYSYILYPNITCFLEDTKILCKVDNKDVYLPIQNISKGTIVKTELNGYKAVDMIGTTKIYNNKNIGGRPKHCIYKCSKEKYKDLTDDLYITGCHSILVNSITKEQREKTIEHLGKIYMTGHRYRLMACVDEKAEIFNEEGLFSVWHIALENNDYYSNYGIYANGGLLVETTSKRYLKELSGMDLK